MLASGLQYFQTLAVSLTVHSVHLPLVFTSWFWLFPNRRFLLILLVFVVLHRYILTVLTLAKLL